MSRFNTRNVRLSALVLAASALAATQMAGSAQAYQCKPGYVQAETIATLKAKSKSSGRKLWTSNVKNSLERSEFWRNREGIPKSVEI